MRRHALALAWLTLIGCGRARDRRVPPSLHGPAAASALPGEAPAPPPRAPAIIPASGGEPMHCPGEMLLVEGEFCSEVQQECLAWMDPPGPTWPRVRCQKFAPTVCQGEKRAMRFCIDRDELRSPGERLPSAGISWTEAKQACEAEGKRLCGEREWTFACEGQQALPYPYGLSREPGRCNHDRLDVRDHRGRLVDRRVAPGDKPACVSPFGVRDMVGNVDEWVVHEEGRPPRRAALKGGWWLGGRNRCRAATLQHDEFYRGKQTGGRCCADPITTAP